MIRNDWKSIQLAVLEVKYGKYVEDWRDTYFQVRDDRLLFVAIYDQLTEAIKSLPDNPNTVVCVAMNRYIKEEKKTLDKIIKVFKPEGNK